MTARLKKKFLLVSLDVTITKNLKIRKKLSQHPEKLSKKLPKTIKKSSKTSETSILS
jgi:hypothetical protein